MEDEGKEWRKARTTRRSPMRPSDGPRWSDSRRGARLHRNRWRPRSCRVCVRPMRPPRRRQKRRCGCSMSASWPRRQRSHKHWPAARCRRRRHWAVAAGRAPRARAPFPKAAAEARRVRRWERTVLASAWRCPASLAPPPCSSQRFGLFVQVEVQGRDTGFEGSWYSAEVLSAKEVSCKSISASDLPAVRAGPLLLL